MNYIVFQQTIEQIVIYDHICWTTSKHVTIFASENEHVKNEHVNEEMSMTKYKKH